MFGQDRAWHLSFGLLLAGSFVLFSFWAFDYAGPGANKLILVLATVVGMFMAFNVGGNDVANSFGTSVGAGTLSMKQALLVAAIFEVSGAVIAGAMSPRQFAAESSTCPECRSLPTTS
ncbi:low-affinity inorganic phosphate transporter [Mycobacterium pseudoshottsii JCM 15466]|nr:putative low-affinity inorganic phosphate transporter [Mycobacterium pseudoshottsii]GAQ37703.1 low-affinity inorganic phosphate transporter [Mycobacterium pseudoshottsii JCM 15466]